MDASQQPYILVLGASIVDITGFSSVKYRPFNSNPGCVKVSLGGVCRNIAETTARLGIKTKFISVLGDDHHGKNIIDNANQVGYDMTDSLFLKGCTTPTYMAILNDEGEMVSAIVDMCSSHQMSTAFIDSKKDIFQGAKYTFLGADEPELLGHILKSFEGQTSFILDPISAAKAETIRHLIPYFHTIKPNRFEAEALVGYPLDTKEAVIKAGEDLLNLGVENIFISLDEEGIYYTNAQQRGFIKAKNVPVVNVTGAGDSFVAGLAFAYMKGYGLIETVKLAIATSVLTISHVETIHPEMGHEKVIDTLSKIQWEEWIV